MFEDKGSKTLGPTLLLPSALTSASSSASLTAIPSSLPASWGLIITLSRPPRSFPKGPGTATLGIGDS